MGRQLNKMAMTITKFGKGGTMVQIGRGWYFLADPVQKFIASTGIQVGDTVQFNVGSRDEKGTGTITMIKKLGGGSAEPSNSQDDTNDDPSMNGSSHVSSPARGNAPAMSTQDSIVRQTVLKATADTLVTLQGDVNLNNVQSIAKSLFDFYYGLVMGRTN